MLAPYIYLNLTNVEFEFLAFENVTIATTGLTRTRSNDSIETTGIELIVQERVNGSSGGTSFDLLLDGLRLLFGFLYIN